MRLSDVLIERTTENMQVLRDCVELIIANMPRRFPVGLMQPLEGYDLNGLNTLIKKYTGTRYEEPIKALRSLTIFFNNSQRVTSTAGSYVGQTRQMGFNISAFLGEAREVTKDELLAHHGDKAIKTFRGIVLHELRHLFQSFLYRNYYYGRGDDENYSTAPVEIDAAWKHHLQDFAAEDYPTADAYAKAVMDSFTRYKALSPKVTEHYRRKTIAYWMQHRGLGDDDPLAHGAKERLQAIRAKTKSMILDALSRIKGDLDLRQLDGYNPEATRFFFPDRAVRGTAGLIAQDKPVEPSGAPIVFLILALAPLTDRDAVRRYLRAVLHTTPNDAIANAEQTFKGGWDAATISRTIARAFG